ncbi:MAG: hypothetical protein ACTHJW_10145 [Streptosporangiaceae bacterium]
MLGRKDYTREELDHAREAFGQQLGAYRQLAYAVASGTDDKAKAALAGFEPLFFANLTLALDRYFVHRLRIVTGKDGNPINEVELLSDSLMNNNGVLRGNNVIKYVPEQSVTKLEIGEAITPTEDDFGRISAAFLDELERKFVPAS